MCARMCVVCAYVFIKFCSVQQILSKNLMWVSWEGTKSVQSMDRDKNRSFSLKHNE